MSLSRVEARRKPLHEDGRARSSACLELGGANVYGRGDLPRGSRGPPAQARELSAVVREKTISNVVPIPEIGNEHPARASVVGLELISPLVVSDVAGPRAMTTACQRCRRSGLSTM